MRKASLLFILLSIIILALVSYNQYLSHKVTPILLDTSGAVMSLSDACNPGDTITYEKQVFRVAVWQQWKGDVLEYPGIEDTIPIQFTSDGNTVYMSKSGSVLRTKLLMNNETVLFVGLHHNPDGTVNLERAIAFYRCGDMIFKNDQYSYISRAK